MTTSSRSPATPPWTRSPSPHIASAIVDVDDTLDHQLPLWPTPPGDDGDMDGGPGHPVVHYYHGASS